MSATGLALGRSWCSGPFARGTLVKKSRTIMTVNDQHVYALTFGAILLLFSEAAPPGQE